MKHFKKDLPILNFIFLFRQVNIMLEMIYSDSSNSEPFRNPVLDLFEYFKLYIIPSSLGMDVIFVWLSFKAISRYEGRSKKIT